LSVVPHHPHPALSSLFRPRDAAVCAAHSSKHKRLKSSMEELNCLSPIEEPRLLLAVIPTFREYHFICIAAKSHVHDRSAPFQQILFLAHIAPIQKGSPRIMHARSSQLIHHMIGRTTRAIQKTCCKTREILSKVRFQTPHSAGSHLRHAQTITCNPSQRKHHTHAAHAARLVSIATQHARRSAYPRLEPARGRMRRATTVAATVAAP
jgi:hypothetical protein